MRFALAAAAVLAPLAGAFAAADRGGGDESASARAWIAEARRMARPDPQAAAPPLPAIPPPASSDAVMTDPFGLDNPTQQATHAPAGAPRASAPAAGIAAPQVRLLGILLQQDDACAVVQVDGALYRVRPGEHLPGKLGRVLRIGEDAVEIAGGGALRMDGTGAGA